MWLIHFVYLDLHICSYVRKKKNYTATKTKKQPNDTGIICVTNSTRKTCKIPARKNLFKFRNMTLERRSIEYDDRTTFNQTFNVIFLTLSTFFRLRVWFLKTVFSRISWGVEFSGISAYVLNGWSPCWMKEENMTKWEDGLRFVAMIGEKHKASKLSKEIWEHLETEEQLENALNIAITENDNKIIEGQGT